MRGVKVTQVVCAGLVVPAIGLFAPVIIGDLHHAAIHAAIILPEQPEAFQPADQPDVPDDPTDIYGNRIAPALSQYRTNASGEVYELHAPQVEIPRLGSPKS